MEIKIRVHHIIRNQLSIRHAHLPKKKISITFEFQYNFSRKFLQGLEILPNNPYLLHVSF